MSSKLFAILTVLVIGIVSFLIGKFLTSSKWKNKYLEADNQNKLLEKRKASVEDDLSKEKAKDKESRKKITELLASNKSKESTIKDLENRIKIKSKTNTHTHTDESYNKVLNALNAEKKKVITLEAQLTKNASSNKRVSTSTFKSFDNDKIGTQKVLHTKPNNIGLLTPILDRMTMFTNLDDLDDLTKIDGIDAAIADIFRKEGIQNYKQIAMLEKRDLPIIAKVAGVTPTQIIEHNWVGVARDLYHQKYKIDL